MRVKIDFDIDKWCIYDEKNFEVKLKKNAPKDIMEKFEKWKNAYNQDELLEQSIIEEKKKLN